MNYTETLSWIHGTERFGSRLGLGRMGRLLHRMGDPHLKVPFIHVAGTNGKGSTTTLIASALTAGGFKTGKFISPYILEFRERMQIDGQMIPEETLAAGCAPSPKNSRQRATPSPSSSWSRCWGSAGSPNKTAISPCWRWDWAAGWTPPISSRRPWSPSSPASIMTTPPF